MKRAVRAAVAASIVALVVATASTMAQAPAPDSDGEWRSFEGTLSAAGRRQTIATEGAPAAVARLSGLVLLTNRTLNAGFRAEALAFDDGASVSAGRVTWTDARGDRVYSVIKGEPLQTGKRIVGSFTGGTGRYAGIVGDYEFTWRYIVNGVNGDDDGMHGWASDLHGRFRRGGGQR